MSSLILRTALRYILPLLLLFSVFLLFRGHNHPGGGFAGGLLGATAVGLYVFAWNERAARRALLIDPHTLVGMGLLLALVSGMVSLLRGSPFLEAIWPGIPFGAGHLTLGTPLLFDIGVYLVVFGVTILIILSFAEQR